MTKSIEKFGNSRAACKIGAALLGVLTIANMAVATAGVVNGSDKRNVISFDLVPNPKTLECLRANYNEEPRARATVVRGKLNDTLILDLDGIKPGLQFDLFTVQHSPFLASGTADPAFTGSFGLAWYQSDIEISRHSDRGHVRISTILLDQIFGFDPDVKLPPTNTFHVGFWFNNPEDAAPCGFNPATPTPFNGEHKAGPFAMISLPEADSKLGPLCTDPNLSDKPVSCDP
jgi:hypothetical protein